MDANRSGHVATSLFSALLLVIPWVWGAAALPTQAEGRETPSFSAAYDPTSTVHLPVVLNGNAPPLNPCAPGQTITDPANDVTLAHIDVLALGTSLNSESLQAIFHLRDVPLALNFDRAGVAENQLEYDWSVFVDVDDDPQTGVGPDVCAGAEYLLSASHYSFAPAGPVAQPISDGVQQVYVWRFDATSMTWGVSSPGTLTADPAADTLTLVGTVPGIQSRSRLSFITYDRNPGGVAEQDRCACDAAAD